MQPQLLSFKVATSEDNETVKDCVNSVVVEEESTTARFSLGSSVSSLKSNAEAFLLAKTEVS